MQRGKQKNELGKNFSVFCYMQPTHGNMLARLVDDYTVIPETTPAPTSPVVITEPTHEEIMVKDIEEYSKQLELLENYEDKAITVYNQLIDLRIKRLNKKKTFFLSLNNTVVPNYTKFVSGLKYLKSE
ncbi:hypothetical protein ACFTAO_22890 [Paenibacillus rhizoplanae]